MPRPQTQRAAYAMTGSEVGSVFRTLSRDDQKAFRAWLAAFNRDAGVYEAQLADRRFTRPRRPAEV